MRLPVNTHSGSHKNTVPAPTGPLKLDEFLGYLEKRKEFTTASTKKAGETLLVDFLRDPRRAEVIIIIYSSAFLSLWQIMVGLEQQNKLREFIIARKKGKVSRMSISLYLQTHWHSHFVLAFSLVA